MEGVIPYNANPGFRIPKNTLPEDLLRELVSFTESESTDRSARAQDIASILGVTVEQVLDQLEGIGKK